MAWFYCDQVEAEILNLERTEEAKKDGADQENGSEADPYQGKYRALLKVRIAPRRRIGSPLLSGCDPRRNIQPAEVPNHLRAQRPRKSAPNTTSWTPPKPIDSFPSWFRGRLPELGEVDYYRLQATQDQVLCFQVDFLFEYRSARPLDDAAEAEYP